MFLPSQYIDPTAPPPLSDHYYQDYQARKPYSLVSGILLAYVLVGIKDHDADRDALIKKMADTVSVEGTLVKKGGTQVIYVSALK